MHVHKLADSESRTAFQQRVLRDLDVAEALLASEAAFQSRARCVGVEQELQFIGCDSRPAPIAAELAASLSAPLYQEEFSRFTFEVALPPIAAGPELLCSTDAALREHLRRIEREASRYDARVVLCGILPSLRMGDIGQDALTASPRYEMLRQLRQDAKGSASEYQIRGIDELVLSNSQPLLLDGVFTSFQLHWQLQAETAAKEYNWSQLIAAPCLAASCCSPIFLGHRLWHETRVTLFQQSSDLRQYGSTASSDERARATLGHGWIVNILDVWKEELSEYVPRIGIEVEEQPEQDLRAGRTPQLSFLQFFNGTVYRWNRLRYGVAPDGEASLRVEARALPAGLSQRDQMANAALWWGLMAAAQESGHGAIGKMPFSRVRESFRRAARDGMESQIYWTDGHLHPTQRLLLDQLLPLAISGLQKLGVTDPEHWLEPVESRARSLQTGSRWMLDTFNSLLDDYDADKSSVLLTEAMVELSSSDESVSRWPLRARRYHHRGRPLPLRCGDSLELALHRLAWEHVDELSVSTSSGEKLQIDRNTLETARSKGLRTVAEAISLRAPELVIDEDIDGRINAFGHMVPLKRTLFRKSGGKPGPLLVIVAGLHGNEPNGVAAAVRFEACTNPISGEIVTLLGNIPALRQGVRFLDHDLNRTFHEAGWSNGTPEGQEASSLWSTLEQLASESPDRERWLVDLHGTSGHTPPYLSALSDTAAWPMLDDLPVPKAVGFERTIHCTLVEYAARRGWKAATFELGALSAPVSVTNGVGILQLIADRLGVAPLSAEERQRVQNGLAAQSPTQGTYDFVYRHAIKPEDCFEMLPGFVSFQALREGEEVGTDRDGPVRAPCSGLILMPLYQPQGESGFYVVSSRGA